MSLRTVLAMSTLGIHAAFFISAADQNFKWDRMIKPLNIVNATIALRAHRAYAAHVASPRFARLGRQLDLNFLSVLVKIE